MVVLFATVGFTPQLALAPLRCRTDVTALHIFFGSPPPEDGANCLIAIRATAQTLGIPLHEHPIEGAFDYLATLEALTNAQRTTDDDIIVNASGGTRVMVMAATIFAFTKNVALVYHDEYLTPDGTTIPLHALRRIGDLGESHRTVLGTLQRIGATDMTHLALEVGLAASTLSVHISRLESDGLVTIRRKGRHRLVSAAPEVMRLLSEANT